MFRKLLDRPRHAHDRSKDQFIHDAPGASFIDTDPAGDTKDEHGNECSTASSQDFRPYKFGETSPVMCALSGQRLDCRNYVGQERQVVRLFVGIDAASLRN